VTSPFTAHDQILHRASLIADDEGERLARRLATLARYREELEALDPAALRRELRDKRADAAIRRAIEKGIPMPAERIESLVQYYDDRLVIRDATTLVRLERRLAESAIVRASWDRALAQWSGDRARCVKTWHTAEDERVRHAHRVMHGQTIQYDQAFETPDGGPQWGPPYAYGCRCWVEIRILDQGEAMPVKKTASLWDLLTGTAILEDDELGPAKEGVGPAVKPKRALPHHAHRKKGGLYVGRALTNVAALRAWADQYGIPLVDDPHVTVVYSRVGVPLPAAAPRVVVEPEQFFEIAPLGNEGAIVLRFYSPELSARWREARRLGATWDYRGGYKAHLTLTYDGAEVDWSAVELPDFALEFGPEAASTLSDDVFTHAFTKGGGDPVNILDALQHGVGVSELRKADEDQRLVTGWASVIANADGSPVVDSQDDIIELDDLVKAVQDFMRADGERIGCVLHERVTRADGSVVPRRIGTIVESLIVTPELKKALALPAETPIGWIVTAKVDDDETWERVKSGELAAWSIGGKAEREEVSV
jgi:hypothetical protein